MANQTQSEQLDKVIERLLGSANAPLSPADAARQLDVTFAPVTELVRDLANLPRPDFRTYLKVDLERRVSMASAAVKPVPDGFRTVTPYLIAADGPALIDFAMRAFGAEEKSAPWVRPAAFTPKSASAIRC